MVQELEKKDIWDKIGRIDYRFVYLVFIILLAIPVIRPIGIPVKVGQITKDYYNTIVNIPTGSVIWIEEWVSLSVWDDIGPIVYATWKALWSIPEERDLLILAFASGSMSATYFADFFKTEFPPPQWRLDTYGETWVDFGYVRGIWSDTGDAALLNDFTDRVFKDDHQYGDWVGGEYFGKAPMEIPVCQKAAAKAPPTDVLNGYDLDLYIYGTWGCTTPAAVVRRYWVRGSPAYKIPQLLLTIGNCVPQALPFYGADKPIRGFIPGACGAAELEILVGYTGEGTRMADLNDLGGVGTVFFLVLGNLAYFGKKYLAKKEEE